MPSPQLPKLAVIAREAGVSVATVSKAINGRADVSPRTRRLVAEVLRRRGYPSPPARRPRGGLVDIVLQGLDSPYALAIFGGVESAAWDAGLDLVVSAVLDRTRHGQPPTAWLERVSARDSAGVLLVRTSITAPQRAWLADHGVPVVIVDPRRPPPEGVPSVASDNVGGAVAATEHLIGLGHRRIAVVTGREGVPCADERLAGHRSAMAAAGLSTVEVGGCFQTEPARRAVAGLLASTSPAPTAFFACSDAMALGVFQALSAHGLRVPDDASVVGFDDSVLATSVTPQLTTVRQPWSALGAAALACLLAPPRERMSLPTELVVRASTAPR
ncbi:LacI family DNA-binding transcriptional regulator [Nonomuraea sp. NPDC050663]|uniref:LacI family DNA-binding transcriptional regulator n=1 Tax=Nonomuraea sp. NPDC050663 TaxID=3364370 RepID=UPI00379D1452